MKDDAYATRRADTDFLRVWRELRNLIVATRDVHRRIFAFSSATLTLCLCKRLTQRHA